MKIEARSGGAFVEPIGQGYGIDPDRSWSEPDDRKLLRLDRVVEGELVHL